MRITITVIGKYFFVELRFTPTYKKHIENGYIAIIIKTFGKVGRVVILVAYICKKCESIIILFPVFFICQYLEFFCMGHSRSWIMTISKILHISNVLHVKIQE